MRRYEERATVVVPYDLGSVQVISGAITVWDEPRAPRKTALLGPGGQPLYEVPEARGPLGFDVGRR